MKKQQFFTITLDEEEDPIETIDALKVPRKHKT
jgi:hypothetical protein